MRNKLYYTNLALLLWLYIDCREWLLASKHQSLWGFVHKHNEMRFLFPFVCLPSPSLSLPHFNPHFVFLLNIFNSLSISILFPLQPFLLFLNHSPFLLLNTHIQTHLTDCSTASPTYNMPLFCFCFAMWCWSCNVSHLIRSAWLKYINKNQWLNNIHSYISIKNKSRSMRHFKEHMPVHNWTKQQKYLKPHDRLPWGEF